MNKVSISNSDFQEVQINSRVQRSFNSILQVSDRLTELHQKAKSKGWRGVYLEFETCQAMIVVLSNAARELDGQLEHGFIGQPKPQAMDLEEAIIGALILESQSYYNVLFLEADHFYSPAHQIIFSIIQDMHRKQIPVDMRTLVVQLRKAGKLELIGGAHYIAELTSKVSSAANLTYHGRILMEFAIKRKLIELGSSLINDAHNDTIDVFEILEVVSKRIDKIKEPITQQQHGS